MTVPNGVLVGAGALGKVFELTYVDCDDDIAGMRAHYRSLCALLLVFWCWFVISLV
jgi:hypothetical protein